MPLLVDFVGWQRHRTWYRVTRLMGGLDMSYSLEYTIRERLATYLAGQMSLSEFEDWFFAETWDIDV